jgi:hypothetical protein
MTIRSRDVLSHVAVAASGFVIGGGLLLIIAMALAAVAFANAVDLVVPMIVTFEGSRDRDGSPSVVIDGSFINAVTVAALFALVWWAISVRIALRR